MIGWPKPRDQTFSGCPYLYKDIDSKFKLFEKVFEVPFFNQTLTWASNGKNHGFRSFYAKSVFVLYE